MSDRRPRVRVLHADPDQPPVLVIDRWSGSLADLGSLDVRGQGFSGALVFQQAIDLDDDGLGEAEAPLEVTDAVGHVEVATRHLEVVARSVARQFNGLGMSIALRDLVGSLRNAVDDLDAARRTEEDA